MSLPTNYAPAKQFTRSETMSQPRPDSEVLGAEFCNELRDNAKAFDAVQENADNSKWAIAKLVNEMYDENKARFENKNLYYAECSKVVNAGCKRKRFSDSGETLRRWCEVQAYYAPFSYSDKLL